MRHEWKHEDGRLAVYEIQPGGPCAVEFLGRGGIFAAFPDDPTVWLDCLAEILRLAARVQELETERSEGIRQTSTALLLKGSKEWRERIAALEEENRRLREEIARRDRRDNPLAKPFDR